MEKIEHVDLREALGEIAEYNTVFHRDTELRISIEHMELAARLNDPTDKTLIWVSHPSGIDCYSEREVFQKDTKGYDGVLSHGFKAERDYKLAYAVDVSGFENGRVFGDIYEIDMPKYADYVKQSAVATNNMRIYIGEHLGSESFLMSNAEFNDIYPGNLPRKTAHWRHEPDDPAALKATVDNIHGSRDGKYEVYNLRSHTYKLRDYRNKFYVRQLSRDIANLRTANSPDGQNFVVPLHEVIAETFSRRQLSGLLDQLPYKNAAFTIQRGQGPVKLVIPRDEVLWERQEHKVLYTVIRDGKVVPILAPLGYKPPEKTQAKPPAKPSILAALKQGAKKIKQQTKAIKAPKKSKETEI